jgi:preprotein translocase subunit SecA
VAEAGVPGAITVATNMAGRGTDIQLGGNVEMRVAQECAELPEGPERDAKEAEIRAEVASLKAQALEAGGLYIIGTERHESRRIDNQLRGRAGRQGDPGRSKFFLSLKDDLMRIFGSDRMDSMLVKLGLKEDEAIVHPWINKALEKAQQKVEARNFDMRKNILKYDNVMNDQRKVVFEQRREMMAQDSLEDMVADMRQGVVEDLIGKHVPHDAYAEAWDVESLGRDANNMLNLQLPFADWAKEEGIGDEEMRERLLKAADESYAARVEKNGAELMRYIEKQIVLQALDHLWREHLVMLDHLRQVVGWRGMAQRDPLNEYKSEAFELFGELINRLRETTMAQLSRVEVAFEPPNEPPLQTMDFGEPNGANSLPPLMAAAGNGGSGLLNGQALPPHAAVAAPARLAEDPSTWGKVGRNEPCPCGSGKKYKHCHGAIVQT